MGIGLAHNFTTFLLFRVLIGAIGASFVVTQYHTNDFTCAEDRRQVADILGINAANIPTQPSWPYHRILEGVLRGEIRGLWVIGTNPAHSWINQGTCRDILGRLDFLVVQDMYHTTETAQLANLVLPAAGWGEKDGTFINSERRFGRVRKVASAPGRALADFHIFRLIAHYWGCGQMFRDWSSPEAVFQILRRLSAKQPCDFTGIADYAMLDRCGGLQWPMPATHIPTSAVVNTQCEGESSQHVPFSVRPALHTQRRLFEDGNFYHPDGRARFVYGAPREFPEQPNRKYPFVLMTGRGSASQWHTQTRTSKSDVLRKLHAQELYVEISSQDAQQLGIRSGDPVRVISQRGQVRARALVTPGIQPGQIFVPMHYDATNLLTHAAFDPQSHQPAYKACAAAVEILA
jgi:assimilatory nitrate reductase catalytic subunit